MQTRDPQPPTGALLKITGATTYTFSLGDSELGDETHEVERELDRPPFGDATKVSLGGSSVRCSVSASPS